MVGVSTRGEDGVPAAEAAIVWPRSPRERRSIFVSLDDMSSLSKAATYWVAGYLHGSEPEPPAGADGVPDFGSAAFRRWERRVAEFRASGAWGRKKPR